MLMAFKSRRPEAWKVSARFLFVKKSPSSELADSFFLVVKLKRNIDRGTYIYIYGCFQK